MIHKNYLHDDDIIMICKNRAQESFNLNLIKSFDNLISNAFMKSSNENYKASLIGG